MSLRATIVAVLTVCGHLAVCDAVPAQVAPAGSSRATDETAIRRIVDEEVAAWNAGDATAYGRHFAEEGTFTNIYGMVFEGHDEFERRHAETFAGFKDSTRRETIRRLKFIAPAVVLLDVDTEVRGFSTMPQGVPTPPDGVLRTRLQQVLVKEVGGWMIASYHNTAITSVR